MVSRLTQNTRTRFDQSWARIGTGTTFSRFLKYK
uniref:Uncharacterized protein n=1 Tax=Anguilla anguilla TaxID=7936 RepID=A0A0E9STB5_ANGAN